MKTVRKRREQYKPRCNEHGHQHGLDPWTEYRTLWSGPDGEKGSQKLTDAAPDEHANHQPSEEDDNVESAHRYTPRPSRTLIMPPNAAVQRRRAAVLSAVHVHNEMARVHRARDAVSPSAATAC